MPKTAKKPKAADGTYPMYSYGQDFGNSEICAVMMKNGKMIMKSMPTAFAKINSSTLKNMGVDMTSSYVIQFQGESAEWGMGDLALLQSPTSIWTGRNDTMRYASKHNLRSILALSASMTNEEEYGLLVTGGLPAEIFQSSREAQAASKSGNASTNGKVDLRKEIKKSITGTHVFSTDSGQTWRTCHIEYAGTLMEGAGALASVDKGKKATGNQAPPPAASIDVGGRTTDLYVAQGNVPIVAFCTGIPLGVVTAESALKDAFKAKFDYELRPIDLRRIMFAYANSEEKEMKPYPEITVYGKAIPPAELEKMADAAVVETAEAIVSFVASSWRESDTSLSIGARFDPCILVGGGAWYFLDALQRRIPHLKRPPNPVFANAIGYTLYSDMQLKKRQLAEIQQEVETAQAAVDETAQAAAAIFLEGGSE